MKYRPEIDGLRAVAVLPVIFFHAGFSAFSGGFIGVDVFFVISGYLITRLILEELARGEFSLRTFYARRARRILPALYVVMLATVPFAWIIMLPTQYEDYAQSLMATIVFAANILFWRESGYFAAEAAEKPLQHLWSLGVEEQYYMLFPLLLIALWRVRRQWIAGILVLATLISLGLSDYASRYYVNVNFFLLPTRAWELLVGSLCALAHIRGLVRGHNGLATLGFALILYAVFCFHEGMRLPSAYSLAPVLGAALIILYANEKTSIAKLLSLRAVVFVGLISYSAYLWHNPLFAFARITLLHAPDSMLMGVLTGVSLLLATLTWHYIEKPFRAKSHPHYVANRRALILAMLCAATLLLVGAHGHSTQGRLEYWKAAAPKAQAQAWMLLEEVKAKQKNHFYDNGDCIISVNMLREETRQRLIQCHQKYGKGIAIIGDSHGTNMFFVLKEKAGTRPFIFGIAMGMCRPHDPRDFCFYDDLKAFLETQPDLFSDVLYTQMGSYLLRRPSDLAFISELPLDARVPDYPPYTERIAAVETYLKSLSRFARVTWVGHRIEPQIREYALIRGGCDGIFALRPNQAELYMHLDRVLAAHLKETTIRYVSQIETMRFDIAQDFMTCDVSYWTDTNHFSLAGEKRFGQRITLDGILGGR